MTRHDDGGDSLMLLPNGACTEIAYPIVIGHRMGSTPLKQVLVLPLAD